MYVVGVACAGLCLILIWVELVFRMLGFGFWVLGSDFVFVSICFPFGVGVVEFGCCS